MSVTEPPYCALGLLAVTVVVVAVKTVSTTGVEVEVASPELPEYTAVMESVPARRAVVVNVDVPLDKTASVATRTPLFRNPAVPRPAPVGTGLMVAVKVTLAPD